MRSKKQVTTREFILLWNQAANLPLDLLTLFNEARFHNFKKLNQKTVDIIHAKDQKIKHHYLQFENGHPKIETNIIDGKQKSVFVMKEGVSQEDFTTEYNTFQSELCTVEY